MHFFLEQCEEKSSGLQMFFEAVVKKEETFLVDPWVSVLPYVMQGDHGWWEEPAGTFLKTLQHLVLVLLSRDISPNARLDGLVSVCRSEADVPRQTVFCKHTTLKPSTH